MSHAQQLGDVRRDRRLPGPGTADDYHPIHLAKLRQRKAALPSNAHLVGGLRDAGLGPKPSGPDLGRAVILRRV